MFAFRRCISVAKPCRRAVLQCTRQNVATARTGYAASFEFVRRRKFSSPASEPARLPEIDMPRDAPRLMRTVAKALGATAPETVAIRVARQTYERCYTQAQRKEWHQVCSLPDTFMSWFVLTHLHVWLAMVRLQIPDSPDAQLVCKELYDVFWEDVEHRIRMTGVDNNTQVSSNIKELNQLFWGALVSYDEGLLYDDIALAGALWRNMFDMRPNTKIDTLARLVGYIREETLRLDHCSDADILAGNISFGDPPAVATATQDD